MIINTGIDELNEIRCKIKLIQGIRELSKIGMVYEQGHSFDITVCNIQEDGFGNNGLLDELYGYLDSSNNDIEVRTNDELMYVEEYRTRSEEEEYDMEQHYIRINNKYIDKYIDERIYENPDQRKRMSDIADDLFMNAFEYYYDTGDGLVDIFFVPKEELKGMYIEIPNYITNFIAFINIFVLLMRGIRRSVGL